MSKEDDLPITETEANAPSRELDGYPEYVTVERAGILSKSPSFIAIATLVANDVPLPEGCIGVLGRGHYRITEADYGQWSGDIWIGGKVRKGFSWPAPASCDERPREKIVLEGELHESERWVKLETGLAQTDDEAVAEIARALNESAGARNLGSAERETLLGLAEDLTDVLSETDWHGDVKGGEGSNVREAFDCLRVCIDKHLPGYHRGDVKPQAEIAEMAESQRASETERRVVVTISSGTFADRCALAQIFHQVLDNFDITNERSKGLIPYSELEMLESDTSVSICVETE